MNDQVVVQQQFLQASPSLVRFKLKSKKILLITANVGTLFEKLDELVEAWFDEIFKIVDKYQPIFIALHMQELCGKNYKVSMELIDPFFRKFLSYTQVRHYNRYLVAFDTDFTDDVQYTALGNIYLIHESLKNVQLFNYKKNHFTKHLHREVYTGNLSENEYIKKERFEKSMFKNFAWSRKGFIGTRWKINEKELNLVNIHLFHDPSNIEALNKSPSIFSENRKLALEYTISKFLSTNIPIAIFGDFNFRLDTSSLVKHYSHLPNTIEIKDDSNQVSKLIFRDLDQKETFTIKTKQFQIHHNNNTSLFNESSFLTQFDTELNAFHDRLFEFDKTFPPSYPFSEEINLINTYMESRCPSWCDRVLLNQKLKSLIEEIQNISEVDYGMMGKDSCMGDHKPIYLAFNFENEENEIDELNDQNNNKLSSATPSITHSPTFNIKLNQNIISYNSLNTTMNRLFILPYDYLTQNYILINNYLFDLNQTKFTNLHNYAKFTQFDSLIIQTNMMPATPSNSKLNKSIENYYQFVENNYNDNYALKTFFVNELNANLLLYKRVLTSMKNLTVNHDDTTKEQPQQQHQLHEYHNNDQNNNKIFVLPQSYLFKFSKINDIYTHLTSPQMISYLASEIKLNDWRSSLVFSTSADEKDENSDDVSRKSINDKDNEINNKPVEIINEQKHQHDQQNNIQDNHNHPNETQHKNGNNNNNNKNFKIKNKISKSASTGSKNKCFLLCNTTTPTATTTTTSNNEKNLPKTSSSSAIEGKKNQCILL